MAYGVYYTFISLADKDAIYAIDFEPLMDLDQQKKAIQEGGKSTINRSFWGTRKQIQRVLLPQQRMLSHFTSE